MGIRTVGTRRIRQMRTQSRGTPWSTTPWGRITINWEDWDENWEG